jgi:hypothetical protein
MFNSTPFTLFSFGILFVASFGGLQAQSRTYPSHPGADAFFLNAQVTLEHARNCCAFAVHEILK